MRRRILAVGLLASVSITGAALTARSPANAAAACDRSATPSSLGSELAAASAGQTVCLASGNYGTFSGTGKAVTIQAADGASVQMRLGLGSGDSGFVLEGMSGMGGTIGDGARNITIRDSAFTGPVNISGSSTDGIVFDANTHNWNVGPSSGGANAKIYLENSLSGTLAAPSVTVQNSEIKNGDLDGIHFGGGSGYQIVGNRIQNLCDMNANHTDGMQFDTSTTTQVRIARNYVSFEACGGYGQAITSYDAGTSGVIIEDNVVDTTRPAGIELYADRNSIVRHNTVRYYPDSGCAFNGDTCGKIDITRKSEDAPGSGTQVYDNVATVLVRNGSTVARNDHNVSGQLAIYVGPLNTYNGFALAAISPVGLGTASDGLNNGIRLNTGQTPTPPPTPPSTPTPDQPADAVWTAPSGARAGTPTTLDGTRSTGDAPITCTWAFEDESGSRLWEPEVDGCTLRKTFLVPGTKYVRLTVTDADGDSDTNKQAFDVGTATAPPPAPDQPADAIWTAPSGADAGTPTTLDGTRSTGNGPITCTWTFEDQSGSTVWEGPVDGCTLEKTFRVPGTKYVRLTVTDADGDTDTNRQSFTVGAL